MSKSREELNVLKSKCEGLAEELRELTPEELDEVTGGLIQVTPTRVEPVLHDEPVLHAETIYEEPVIHVKPAAEIAIGL